MSVRNQLKLLVGGLAAGRRRPVSAAPGGINQQAIAAIENALVDLKAKALGIPVYELLGGPIRDRLRLYWSHCGSYRAMYGEKFREWTGSAPIRTLDDVERLEMKPDPCRFQHIRDLLSVVRQELRGALPVLVFAGAPFTVATYCINTGKDIAAMLETGLHRRIA